MRKCKPGFINAAADALTGLIVTASLLIAAGCIFINIRERLTGEMGFLFGYKPVYIESGSMEPVIPSGSFIIVKKASFDDVKEGDVIVFETDGGYVTHRYIGIDEASFNSGSKSYIVTKGDANSISDPELLDPLNIRGKAIIREKTD